MAATDDVRAEREGLCGWPDCGCEGDEACRLAQHVLMEEKRADRATARAELAEAEAERLREALEIIAGRRPCLDNLMSNADIATAALQPRTHSHERRNAAYLAECEALSAKWIANCVEQQRQRVVASIEKETPDAERADGEAADRA